MRFPYIPITTISIHELSACLSHRLYYLNLQQVGQFRNLLNLSKVMDDL